MKLDTLGILLAFIIGFALMFTSTPVTTVDNANPYEVGL